MSRYMIYDAEKPIGEAHITREGMYWQVRCSCHVLTDKPPRICAKWDGGSVSLGRCVPDGKCMTLFKRVPMNKLGLSGIGFTVESESGRIIPVVPDSPLACISDLKNAKLKIVDGQHYLELPS